MLTSIISNVLVGPTGAIAGVPVAARLRRGFFRVDDSSELGGYVTTTSNGSGAWSLTLERQSNVSPRGSWWEIVEFVPDSQGGPRQWAIAVPDVDAVLPDVLTQIPSGVTAAVTVDDLLVVHKAGAETINGPKAVRGLSTWYYDTAETFPERNAIFTLNRQVPSPSGFFPTMHLITQGLGDNTTFKGVAGLITQARDLPSVGVGTKGVLYAFQAAVVPLIDRSNVPFDDVVAVSVENQGSAVGTDAVYFAHNRSDVGANPTAHDWGTIVQNDAWANNFVRSSGHHVNGLDLTGATLSGAALYMANQQKIAAKKTSGAFQELVRLDGNDTLTLYEDRLRVLNNNDVLMLNAGWLAWRNAANNANIQVATLDATDTFHLYGNVLRLFSTGEVAVQNNAPIVGRNSADSAYVDLVRLNGSNDLQLYAAKVTILSNGGMFLNPVSSIPSTPGGSGFVIYNDAGTLKAKGSSGTITPLAVA